ncbi:MAG TPA: MauE/DoxX family redox-associated membrane protein [Streptosporangiaceae bacterium]|nr:MauE/DoxX family redox-associated membrane protein [Streptosporangiaceae bacterium]
MADHAPAEGRAAARAATWGGWAVAQPWLTTAARYGLAVVLGLAGWTKVTEPPSLQKLAVRSYQILPEGMVSVVGIGLPVLELALAAMLVLGFATRLAAVASALLLIVFIGGIISVWVRGLSIDCGCFGGGGAAPRDGMGARYLREVLRDLGFLVVAGWIVALPKSRLALDRVLGLYRGG